MGDLNLRGRPRFAVLTRLRQVRVDTCGTGIPVQG
jgi:hypothetical protein